MRPHQSVKSLANNLQDPNLRETVLRVDRGLEDLHNAVTRLASNQEPNSSGTSIIVVGGRGGGTYAQLQDRDYGDIRASVSGTVLTVESAGGRTFVNSVAGLSDALAFMTGGGVIYLAPGTYTLPTTLYIVNSGIVLHGSGQGVTIIRMLDYNQDIISIRAGATTLKGLTIHHGTSADNGSGGLGHGRGVVIDKEVVGGIDYITGVTLEDVDILGTSSWCLYDTGVYAYEDISYGDGFASAGIFSNTAEHPFPIWGRYRALGASGDFSVASCTTTIDSKTVTSSGGFANVRVGQYVYGTGIPHATYVTAKASNSSITISNKATASSTPTLTFKTTTNCCLTVELTLNRVTLAFPNSGGAFFSGYGGTTTRVYGLKTNSYSFGSFAAHADTTPAGAVTLGSVHLWGHTAANFDSPIFQSPSAQGGGVAVPHDDVDATMLSFQAVQGARLYSPYFEVLSAYCEDGVDWRNGPGTVGLDKDRAGNYIGYRQNWLITGQANTAVFIEVPTFQCTTRRKDPDQLAAWGNYYEGYPARILRSMADEGGFGIQIKGGRVAHWRKYFSSDTATTFFNPFESGDFYPCLQNGESIVCTKTGGVTLTSAGLFGSVNVNDPVYGPGIPISTYVSAKASNSSLTLSAAATDSLTETLRFGRRGQPWDRDDFLLQGFADGTIEAPIFTEDLRVINWQTGRSRDVSAPAGTAIWNRECFRLNGSRSQKLGFWLDNDLTGVTSVADDIRVRTAFSQDFKGGFIGYTVGSGSADGAVQREGLWGISARGNDFRQIPWIRIHPSTWSPVYAGDQWMEVGAPSAGVYTTAKYNFYDGTFWRSVVGLPRTTTAAGDLIYYGGVDNPVRRAIGSAGQFLKVDTGVPTWSNTILSTWTFNDGGGIRTPVCWVDSSGSYSGTGLSLTGDGATFGEFQVPTLGLSANRFWTLPDASGSILVSGALATLVGSTSSTFASNTATAGASFIDATTNSKRLRMVLSGAVGNNSFTFSNTAARNYGFGNLSGNVPIVGDDPPSVASGNLGKVDSIGQTAAISSTNLSSTPPAGIYAVEVYAVCTVASGSGSPTLDVTIGWTDVLGATTANAAGLNGTTFPLSLSATGRAQAKFVIQVNSGNITYSTTINSASGTPTYALYIRVVSLG